MTHIPTPLRFKLYCWWVDTRSALKEYHRRIVRRAMKSVKCNGCGYTISVYRMEHHLSYRVDGVSNCESHQQDQRIEKLSNAGYEKEKV